ncbi:hypothetical protein PRIPAC_73562 [Pristionchus pacificus]|uniref:Uncharacterized protein n=1 Tax=Pristionchus pacificus TaxID=54126 RepID=A0A2A6CFM0_PRIPA|nr:hypothetical protein PRIPAC_73562 [Pristionchus pacificus]|eukprot:PDM76906.1 hypothetical protein PRIPAC_42301 [Pristionchus pacificus]
MMKRLKNTVLGEIFSRSAPTYAGFYVPVALVIAFLLGCADSCFNTVRTVICALVLPAQRTEAFSISKFYQSLTCCILLFVANKLTVPAFTGMLAVKCLLAAMLYFVVVARARTGDAESTRTARQSAAAARGTLPFLTRLGIRPAESTATAGTAHSATDVLGDQEKDALLKPELENPEPGIPEPADWQGVLARTQSVRSQSSDKSVPSSSKTSMDSATMEETA